MIAFIWSKPMITNYKEQFVQKKRTFFAYGKSMSVQKSTGTLVSYQMEEPVMVSLKQLWKGLVN